MTKSHQQYIELYHQCRDAIFGHSAEAMNRVREHALHVFESQLFPSRKTEDYRYTDINALFAPDYGLNLNRLNIPVNPQDVFSCAVPNLSTALFFVVNDIFIPNEARQQLLPKGVHLSSITQYAAKNPRFIEKYYSTLSACHNDSVTALNSMFAQDGLVLHVDEGVQCEQTLQVVNLLRADVDLMVNRRLLIVLERNAKVQMLFCDHALDNQRFLTTEVAEIVLEEGASLDYFSLEETHTGSTRVSNTYVTQLAHTHFSHNSLTLHNGTTRNHLHVSIQGEHAECVSNGCAIADKTQHVDNHTLIEHTVSNCTSEELYKYVLSDQAVGAFAGKVKVNPGAQHTTSAMTNRNLTMGNDARMYTQPILEIYADDVKCSHGSTIGQLNDAALFYMQQRGISREEAQMLLQSAFLNDVIDKIALIPLRDRLRYLVEKRLRGELNQCEGCQLCQ